MQAAAITHWTAALSVPGGSIPFVEKQYGYRCVDNTLVDKQKRGNSADRGLNARGVESTAKEQKSRELGIFGEMSF